MTARILDGTAIAKSIRERIGAEIAERQKANPRYKPSLKIIQGTPAISTALNVPRLRFPSSPMHSPFSFDFSPGTF
jgi:methylenetetrahydrofolate dehydrogenase (NADP+)/methenyltetrahydrofolate cyclohydrolase/formyltetrahydrofolate synthetase